MMELLLVEELKKKSKKAKSQYLQGGERILKILKYGMMGPIVVRELVNTVKSFEKKKIEQVMK